MPRRTKRNNPNELHGQLIKLIRNFERHLQSGDLREKVRKLVPANHLLRDLGVSLISDDNATSARDRIELYLRKHVGQVIDGDELMVVAGISEYGRRVRELRVQFGWPIVTGISMRDIEKDKKSEEDGQPTEVPKMKTDECLLLADKQDAEAAYRWNIANDIRKDKGLSVQNKILKFLRSNVGKTCTSDELRYVANNKSEWARRVRELRTEEGWPVATKTTGRPDLPVGLYVLEDDRQTPPHDRSIKEGVRREALRRDQHTCKLCGWTHDDWNRSDPRHLELHHIKEHAKGGSNEIDNLITLCNICHDDVHAERKQLP